jgi:8-oxo-dGTP diphosphatase
MKPIIQKIIVAGIVLKDNKVLIIQRSADEESYPNLWELPSGKRELLETSEDAVIREVKEETNLEVKVTKPVSIFEFKNEKPTEIRDSTQINFLVEYVSGEVKLSNEHQNFAWITKGELKNYNASDTVKKAILKAFEL